MVSNNYGMTEAGSVYCLMPPGEAVKRPGSVGKPLPPAEVRIVDAEEPTVPAGEVGEVRLRSPGRQREYFGDPEATARTWVDGWLVTGDLGRVDEDGYLYIVGRSKDVIIRGGNNIHPTDVEHVIESAPGGAERSPWSASPTPCSARTWWPSSSCAPASRRSTARTARPHPGAAGRLQGAPPVAASWTSCPATPPAR